MFEGSMQWASAIAHSTGISLWSSDIVWRTCSPDSIFLSLLSSRVVIPLIIETPHFPWVFVCAWRILPPRKRAAMRIRMDRITTAPVGQLIHRGIRWSPALIYDIESKPKVKTTLSFLLYNKPFFIWLTSRIGILSAFLPRIFRSHIGASYVAFV